MLDHVWMMCAVVGAPAEIHALKRGGLVESCRRVHPGMGVANVFFCFDNAFLELIWVTDTEEAAASPLTRTQLIERSKWRHNGTTPFGIGLRLDPPDGELPFAARSFGQASRSVSKPILVATSSDDLCQPLLFRAQRNSRPDAWTDGLAGSRQRQGGFAEISGVRLDLAADPAADLLRLRDMGLLSLGSNPTVRMIFTLSRLDGGRHRYLTLPDISWTDETPA